MKKHKFIILAVLLPILLLSGCVPVSNARTEIAAEQQQEEETASDPSPAIDDELKKRLDDGKFEYEVDDGSITITKYTGTAASVTIPHGVTTIGEGAFGGCENLTSVTIPDSVTSIASGPFTFCSKLTEIRVSAGNTHFKSEDGILFTADRKTLVQVPAGKGLTEYTIPDSVTTIGEGAFGSCTSLTSVTIPESVTTIGREAFTFCFSLTSVTIPESVTTIGERAFDNRLTIYG